MITEKEHNPENSKVFEAFSDDSKKFEILMKKGLEQSKLMFQMVVKEESKKKFFVLYMALRLYDIWKFFILIIQ